MGKGLTIAVEDTAGSNWTSAVLPVGRTSDVVRRHPSRDPSTPLSDRPRRRCAADPRLQPGRILRGKWRLEAKLGEGGMATVWLAAHRNGLRVAVKALRPELGTDLASVDRFLREGSVTNRIDHPGIVAAFDDDTTEDGVIFLVFELLKGKTLRQHWLDAGKQLRPIEVVTIAIEVLGVLAAAHAAGVTHLDVKPDNVFLDKGGVKLLDFGVARMPEIDGIDQLTCAGPMLGTPAFMAPEQALGHWDRVDARSDVFAMGATMWTLLTGTLVHEATTMHELLIAAGTAQACSIATRLPQLDRRLASIIDRALRFRPEDRWQSADQMREALEDVVDEPSTEVMAPQPPVCRQSVPGSCKTVAERLSTTLIMTRTDVPYGNGLPPGFDPIPTTAAIAPGGRPRTILGLAAAILALLICAASIIAFLRPPDPLPDDTIEEPLELAPQEVGQRRTEATAASA